MQITTAYYNADRFGSEKIDLDEYQPILCGSLFEDCHNMLALEMDIQCAEQSKSTFLFVNKLN